MICRREGPKHNIEPMGSVRGWAKAHSSINPDPTRGLSLRSEDIETTLIQT